MPRWILQPRMPADYNVAKEQLLTLTDEGKSYYEWRMRHKRLVYILVALGDLPPPIEMEAAICKFVNNPFLQDLKNHMVDHSDYSWKEFLEDADIKVRMVNEASCFRNRLLIRDESLVQSINTTSDIVLAGRKRARRYEDDSDKDDSDEDDSIV